MNSPTESMEVAPGTVVALHYTLYDESREVLDASKDDPIHYLHGAQNIVSGLENGLVGHRAGERVQVTVPPENGYGQRHEGGQHKLPRENFPGDVELQPGMPLGAEGPDGQRLTVWVVAIEPDGVTLDLNHPLAGKTLMFDVAIESVREATSEELAAGRPLG
jgi:FKBP-type peptidyl-prolyl cis-trans isomerase SlyD